MRNISGDLDGKRFGKLTVIREDEMRLLPTGYYERRVLCKCDCGNTKILSKTKVRNKHTQSCGCLRKQVISKHGMSQTKVYAVWMSMKSRCNNENDKAYENYGGRGIKCLWKNFEEFYKDMGEGYKIGLEKYGKFNTTIDRIDNDGNYEPSNCRWTSRAVQQANTRWNVNVEIEGVTKHLSQWTRELKLKPHKVNTRIYRDGWSPKDALTTPFE